MSVRYLKISLRYGRRKDLKSGSTPKCLSESKVCANVLPYTICCFRLEITAVCETNGQPRLFSLRSRNYQKRKSPPVRRVATRTRSYIASWRDHRSSFNKHKMASNPENPLSEKAGSVSTQQPLKIKLRIPRRDKKVGCMRSDLKTWDHFFAAAGAIRHHKWTRKPGVWPFSMHIFTLSNIQ